MGRDASRSPFDVHPGVTMVRNWRDMLPEKTGRSLEEWVALVQSEGPASLKERRAWLKDRFQLGTNTAWWITDRSLGKGTEDDDPEAYLHAAAGWVDAMFAGKKTPLRLVFEKLLRIGKEFGDDVKVCPCQTIVPFYRRHVFAQARPATGTRLDLGFALGDTPATGRLVDTGGLAKKDRITHRIALARTPDIDDEVLLWFQTAYKRDATG
jgi:Domain of unknown function (DUF5655)/Domain of unknown function (DUF4287)